MSSSRPSPLSIDLYDTYADLTFPGVTAQEVKANWANIPDSLATLQQYMTPDVKAGDYLHMYENNIPDSHVLSPNVYRPKQSAFSIMMLDAFNQHHAVVLRPDDLHLLIIQGFTRILQKFPEDFRSHLVAYTDKQPINLDYNEELEIDSKSLPPQFAEKIREHIKAPHLVDALLQAYSGSTDENTMVKAITLMGTFSAYFTYNSYGMCDIPRFILEGSVEDWEKLSSLPMHLLAPFGSQPTSENENGLVYLQRWLTRLQPILNKMMDARKGIADAAFWKSFFQSEHPYNSNYVTGNMIYFYPFLQSLLHLHDQAYDKSQLYLNVYILGKEVILGDKITRNGFKQVEAPSLNELPDNVLTAEFRNTSLTG